MNVTGLVNMNIPLVDIKATPIIQGDNVSIKPTLDKEQPKGGSCTIAQLEEVLSKPPPNIEIIDEYEAYLIQDDGTKKRICGHPIDIDLPSLVPEGIKNPHDVKNPYLEYRCCEEPALMRDGESFWGPCEKHLPQAWKKKNGDPSKVFKRGLQKSISQKGQRDKENMKSGTNELQSWIDHIQDTMTVEQLLDGTRLLFEMEALRALAKEKMSELGYDQDQSEHIASLMVRQTDMRLKMAKADNELLKNQALSAVLKVILNGVVAIVEEQLGPAAAASVLSKFKETLVIPITEQGFTEVLRRQQAMGLNEPIELSANEFQVQHG